MEKALRSSPEVLERFAEAVQRYGIRRGYEVLEEAHTTSDFPILLQDTMNKVLQASYTYVNTDWQRFTRQVDVGDFKEQKVIRLSEADDLLPVSEMGEYRDSTLSETEERYKVAKYGRDFSVSWEAVVNDDLNAIQRQPERFGRAAGRLVRNMVFDILKNGHTATYAMSDGQPLFSAAHNNLITSALSETGLQNALLKLRRQTDDKGNVIQLRPRYLIVPPELEFTARKLLQSTTSTVANQAGVINPAQGLAELIVAPELTDPNDWYLLADPADVDGIYVAFLRLVGRSPQLFLRSPGWTALGGGVPDVRQGVGQHADDIKYRVRHVVGVKAVDWRFAVKAQVA